MPELEAVTISHYQMHHHLAKGGMSQIYLAHDLRTGQMVALKMVRCDNQDYSARFWREKAVIARLQHEHILPALAHGEFADWYYLVTPYIEYGTLTRRLDGGPISLEETGNILTQLADALHYAHERGILHRDIKPANILLDGGQHVYLADFGLAQQAGANNRITRTDLLIGTANYMAPELAEYPATTSSDIYALGVLLYQMLTGSVPFSASTPVCTFLKHIYEQPRPPSHLNPAIPYSVEQVILRALAKEPQARFATANDLAHAYQQALVAKTTRPLPVEVTIVPVTRRKSPFSINIGHKRRRETIPVCNNVETDVSRPAHNQYGKPLQREQNVAVSLLAVLLLCIIPLFMGFSFSYFQSQFPQTAPLEANIPGKMTHAPPEGTASTATPIPSSQPAGSFDFSDDSYASDALADNNQAQGDVHDQNNGHKKGHSKRYSRDSMVTNNAYSPLEGFDP